MIKSDNILIEKIPRKIKDHLERNLLDIELREEIPNDEKSNTFI